MIWILVDVALAVVVLLALAALALQLWRRVKALKADVIVLTDAVGQTQAAVGQLQAVRGTGA